MVRKAVVAGHICIDITPKILDQASKKIHDVLVPGRLLNVGDADIHTGGAVANTGLAMKLLGADVTLVGKIGDDALGDMVMIITDEYEASEGFIRSKGDSTSYSVVLAFPGTDRIFLHNPGANDTFCPDDLPMDIIREAALFHFGYPPLMKRIYERDGAELVELMRRVREAGAATSLDLAAVDPDTEAGKADWKLILENTLPYVDIFVPSIEELLFMLDREKYDRIRRDNPDSDLTGAVDLITDIEPLGEKCLDMGARIVLIKCGEPGMYYRTKSVRDIEKISSRLSLDTKAWANKKGFEKSYRPERVLSGTGAGDTSVAAFLTSMLNGKDPEDCVRYAAATGACCVEAYDALSGLKSFRELDEKLGSGWPKNH
ncbi:MAG: carbohydrate kinase family protein [Lachnospiraceae bacterium]|nr:carbohydrate kinase family protein [Lachnospiraceae bacterium]